MVKTPFPPFPKQTVDTVIASVAPKSQPLDPPLSRLWPERVGRARTRQGWNTVVLKGSRKRQTDPGSNSSSIHFFSI